MNEWKKVTISDILTRVKRPIELKDNNEYRLVTIKLYHKGVKLRCVKKGQDIKSKMYEVKGGDFILSGIDARNGAFGIVGKELEGAIVTNDFWYFKLNEKLIDKYYFLELTSTKWFDEICRLGSDGTTQRIRLQKNKFFNQEVFLPPIALQQKLYKKYSSIKQKNSLINEQNNIQKESLSLLRQRILNDAISGKLTANWRKKNSNSKTASDLLLKIKKNKEKILKDKNLRNKNFTIKDIQEKDHPFKLPPGWGWCRFDDVAYFSLGKTPPSKDSSYWENGTLPWVSISDMKEYGRVTKTNKLVTVKARQDIFKHNPIPKNTLLMSFKLTIGRTSILDVNAYHNEAIISILPYLEKLNLYLFYFMPIFSNWGKKRNAVKGKTLNSKKISNLLISIPPEQELDIILLKTEKLLKKINSLSLLVKRNKETTDLLVQSVLSKAFVEKK
jgi:type I restriction enzyme S subunit